MRLATFILAASLSLSASALLAQPLTIATGGQGSSTHNMGLAISKASSEVSGLDLRPAPFKSTSQASPLVNTGELDFGLENAVGLVQAIKGTGRFEGQAQENLRVVARLLPLRFTFGVRADSSIRSIEDLRGKRLPSGFGTTVTGEMLISTMLGTGGLSYDDVEQVPVASFGAMAKAFVDGEIDAYIFIPGSPRDVNISLQVGGLQPIDLPNTDQSNAFVAEVLPVGRLFQLEPADDIQDVVAETTILQYDYFIYSNAGESEDTIRAFLEALHGGKEIMTEVVPGLKWFEPELMYLDIDIPFHPAALAFFEEKGIPRR